MSDTPDSSSDDDYVFRLREATVNKVQKDQPKMTVKINNSNVHFLIDTGSKIYSRKSEVNQNVLTPIQEYSHMDQTRPYN